MTRLWAMCTVESGEDYLHALQGRVPIEGVIGLSDRPATDAISGFRYMGDVAKELGIDFVAVDDYRLAAPADRDRLRAIAMDSLFVCGWQRLIPTWLIEKCDGRVVGTHGSASGIQGGRGRSPLNWAILLGADRFEMSIFFMDEGIDSGKVIGSGTFPITELDDIRSGSHKCALVVADLLSDALASGALERREGVAQPADAFYLPRRAAEDGRIDWRRSTRELHAFIRALSQPYPGAFSEVGSDLIVIWRGRPFRWHRKPDQPAGTIVATFADGSFVVVTGDGALQIDSSESRRRSDWRPKLGARFESADFVAQMREIIDRHRSRYPDLPLSPEILRTAE